MRNIAILPRAVKNSLL